MKDDDAISENAVPRIIWMLWLQGFENAPTLVKECYRSWKLRNPEWEIRLLNSENFDEYANIKDSIDINRPDLSRAHLADIIRIKLLADHGGVWCDATCFCVRPLDEWIDGATRSGFFCFLGHRVDTPMSNWFMAARKNSYIARKLFDESLAFWKANRFPAEKRPHLYRLLKFLFNRNAHSPKYWFSYPIRKWLRVRPYFWFQYMFGILCREDAKFGSLWSEAPHFGADEPHRLQKAGILDPLTEEVRLAIDNHSDYLYKLTWKLHKHKAGCNANNFPSGSNLDYLLRSLDARSTRDS